MQKISIALNQNKIYFAGFSAILFAAILFLLVNGKEAAFISLNSYHPFYLNVFLLTIPLWAMVFLRYALLH